MSSATNLPNCNTSALVGYSPGDSSSTGDFSIIRLSLEVPVGLKTAIKPCNRDCIKKSPRRPMEFSLNIGYSEVVGRLAIGFGDKSFELAALNAKLYSGGYSPKPYVKLFVFHVIISLIL